VWKAAGTLAAVIRLPAARDPEVSAIVLLDGAAELAERCLRALAAADGDVACETIVLLNDPDEELEQLVRRSTTGARAIACRANAGPGVGWNLGAAVARAPRLATLHEDSEPEPGWLRPLCETMDESGAGAVGSRLLNGDGSVQNCGWALFSDASHLPLNAATAPEVAAASEPTPADMLSGAAMLVDREAVRAVGGWDERFHPAVFMDIDVSTAIRSSGRPVLSVPASRVVHAGGTFDRRPNSPLTGPQLRHFLLERNGPRFVAKWGALMRELAPPPADHDPETVRAAVGAAHSLTRARAERLGSEERPGPAAQAERPFTGVEGPVVEGEDGFAVAPAVEAALRAGERELVDDYCRWLAEREGQVSTELAAAEATVAEQARELAELRTAVAAVEQQNREVHATLAGVVNSRSWRLRNSLARLLRR
ncbi:MAG TPA: glycosyltransferase, partial [Solirubrobacterales bacterium]|nr:glycosyltransferase [Solirubrobacterales bacterium]